MTRALSPWHDPVVCVGALVGAAATAWVLFSGAYLPYIDWSNHLGLISVLAHGQDNGGLAYLERSFAPSPYFLFYATSALLAQLFAADAAAKIALVIASALWVFSGASLLAATGRSPRLAIMMPLFMFGISMGYGFVSFVFTTPFLFGALAATEYVLRAPTRLDARKTGMLFAWLAACAIGHGLVFALAALLIAVRAAFFVGARLSAVDRGQAMAKTAAVVVAGLGAFVFVLPSVLRSFGEPRLTIDTASSATSWFVFEPWASHINQLGGHLLERGSSHHWTVMYVAAGVLIVWLALGFFRPHVDTSAISATTPKSRAIEIYAAVMVVLFLFGPSSLERPVNIWMLYPRFGVIACALLFLVPRPRLVGPVGVVISLVALAVVLSNAALNRSHIREFSSWASGYDGVRAVIPKGSRVLALTVVSGGDIANIHPAMGSLYFYHLVDGAAYTAFLFDVPLLPVRSRTDRAQPRAPNWRTPDAFDPRSHGVDFDYLVLRGQGLIDRTERASLHDLVGDFSGWKVFRTRQPAPWP